MAAPKEEVVATPFVKKYFSADVMMKYEPLMDAICNVEETFGQDDEIFTEFETHWQKFMDFSWTSQWDGKKYDVVFYGVGGYSGFLIMEYLKRETLKKKALTNFAFAGPSSGQVAEMRDRVFEQTEFSDTPILTASFEDACSMIDLVKSAKVIVNVAGPYMLSEGEVLVDACIWCKTDYVDISEEIPWCLKTKELHKYAKEAGVMIVPSCASSAYADIGTLVLAKKIKEQSGASVRSAVCYCQGGGALAGVSGEALKTRAAMSQLSDAAKDAMKDPFSLGGFIPNFDRNGVKMVEIQMGTGACSAKTREEDKDINMSMVTEDKNLSVWRAPYKNSFFDTRTVRRSNMLQADLGGSPYGMSFNFMEYCMLPAESISSAKAAAKKDDTVAPYSMSGIPEEEELQELDAEAKHFTEGEGPMVDDFGAWTGHFLSAESTTGTSVKCSFVGADAYYESARVAVETALTLSKDRGELAFKGGCLTPSAAGGFKLLEKLMADGKGVRYSPSEWLDGKAPAIPS